MYKNRITSEWLALIKINILQEKSVDLRQGWSFPGRFSGKIIQNGVNLDAYCGSLELVMEMNHTSLEALRIKF